MSDDHGHGWRSTCGLGVCGSGSGTMMAWCADVVLLPLARMYAGPQPCAVASLNSYKRPTQTTLSAGSHTAVRTAGRRHAQGGMWGAARCTPPHGHGSCRRLWGAPGVTQEQFYDPSRTPAVDFEARSGNGAVARLIERHTGRLSGLVGSCGVLETANTHLGCAGWPMGLSGGHMRRPPTTARRAIGAVSGVMTAPARPSRAPDGRGVTPGDP